MFLPSCTSHNNLYTLYFFLSISLSLSLCLSFIQVIVAAQSLFNFRPSLFLDLLLFWLGFADLLTIYVTRLSRFRQMAADANAKDAKDDPRTSQTEIFSKYFQTIHFEIWNNLSKLSHLFSTDTFKAWQTLINLFDQNYFYGLNFANSWRLCQQTERLLSKTTATWHEAQKVTFLELNFLTR